jgi:hypothetical protein
VLHHVKWRGSWWDHATGRSWQGQSTETRARLVHVTVAPVPPLSLRFVRHDELGYACNTALACSIRGLWLRGRTPAACPPPKGALGAPLSSGPIAVPLSLIYASFVVLGPLGRRIRTVGCDFCSLPAWPMPEPLPSCPLASWPPCVREELKIVSVWEPFEQAYSCPAPLSGRGQPAGTLARLVRQATTQFFTPKADWGVSECRSGGPAEA